MFYIDKLLDGKVSIKDTKDGISEIVTVEDLIYLIKSDIKIFGFDKEEDINSIEYLPLNNLGNYSNILPALASYKHDTKGLDEGEFVIRYMNSIKFRETVHQIPLCNSRTSNKGVFEKTLIKRALVEVQGHILESKTFSDLKNLVVIKGVLESGKYRYYDDWSILEYSAKKPNTIYWRVRMD